MRPPMVFDEQRKRFRAVASVSSLVAEAVRAERERRGWSQAELAQRINELSDSTWHQTTVNKLERQLRQVSINEVVLLAVALEVSPLDLLVPEGEDHLVLVAEQHAVTAPQARQWFAGLDKLPSPEAILADGGA